LFPASFNPSRGIALIQAAAIGSRPISANRFNPSRGIALIQASPAYTRSSRCSQFQSLTRDSAYSSLNQGGISPAAAGFNPSRGIALIQAWGVKVWRAGRNGFNPSRGIALIQALHHFRRSVGRFCRFNPSRGIALIQARYGAGGPDAGRQVSIPHAG